MNRYGVNRSPSFGVYSSTFGDELTAVQSSMDSGWKWNTPARIFCTSSGVGFSKSTQRKEIRVRQQRRHEEQINVPRVQASLRGEGK